MKKIGLPSYIRHIVKEDNRSARFTCGLCMSGNQCWSTCQKTVQTCQTTCQKSKQCSNACEKSAQCALLCEISAQLPVVDTACYDFAERYRPDGTNLNYDKNGNPIKCYEDYSGVYVGGPMGGGCTHDWVYYHGVWDCVDGRGHEWYKKCSICKTVIGMGEYKPGVLKWEVTALNTLNCKLWGYCDHCGKPHYQYPLHNFVNGVCTVCGYSGAFKWSTPKIKGQPFILTADEWNTFCDMINQKRKVKGLNAWRFTRVYKGNNVTASIFNDVRQSISGMGGRNLPATVSVDQNIEAYHLNALVDSFNAI